MTTVFLCRGSDCRKRKLSRSLLELVVEDCGANVEVVRCQKVCKSPVIGTDAGEQIEWFARMDSPKALRALRHYLEGGRIETPLAKRRAKKRRGKIR